MFHTEDNNGLQIKKWQHVGQCDFNFDQFTSRCMPQQLQTEACLITLCPAYFHSCCGICSWHWRPTNVKDWTHKKKQGSTANLSTQKQRKTSKEIREWERKKLPALYLAEILQQRVWNVVASPGKFREDSGAGPLQPQTPCGGQIQLLCPLSLLWILSFSASHGRTESLRLLSAAQTAQKKGEKVVWLLFLWMMSHPDFVSAVRLCLYVGVCVEDL